MYTGVAALGGLNMAMPAEKRAICVHWNVTC